MSEKLLEITDLTVEYTNGRQTVHALNGIDLTLERGETLGLVGETGAGKTTTALSVLRLLPDRTGKIRKGDITFDGIPLLRLNESEMQAIRGGRISMIFQDPMTALNPVIPVGEQIRESLVLHDTEGKSGAEISQRVDEMLTLVGIYPERRGEYPHQFSGGMKQRVVIAMALACSPELLIADEPTTALDVTIQAQVLKMMQELKEKLDMSIIMITHDLGIIAKVCDKVAVMYSGEIVESGTFEDFFLSGHHHPYTKGLFGSIPDIFERGGEKNWKKIIDLVRTDCTDIDRMMDEMYLCEYEGGLFNGGAAQMERPNAFIIQQGRAAESVLFEIVKKIMAERHPGKSFVIPSNGHFDTTEGNIKQMGSIPRNLFNKELLFQVPEGGKYEKNPFKGDMDNAKLEELIQTVGPENVPLIYTTITNNTVCGQAVSMKSIRATAEIAHKYDIPFMFDVARWAENCYFIKVNEEGYADKSIAEIATEMFSYCDGFTMSAKKDGHANMGGMLAFRDKGCFWRKFSDFNEDGTVKNDIGVQIKVKQISCYGNDSYGGMSGRDIMALATGLYESCNFNYLKERVEQCEYLAQGFYKAGVKGVVLPAGGHGVYINMDEFFDNERGHDTFAGQGFSLELIRRYGIRTSELGDYSMEYDLKTPEQQAEVCNVVRFAVNRSQLSQEHMDYVIAAVKALYEDRASIPNMRIVKGRTLPMRHFHAFLEPYPNEPKD